MIDWALYKYFYYYYLLRNIELALLQSVNNSSSRSLGFLHCRIYRKKKLILFPSPFDFPRFRQDGSIFVLIIYLIYISTSSVFAFITIQYIQNFCLSPPPYLCFSSVVRPSIPFCKFMFNGLTSCHYNHNYRATPRETWIV